MKLKMTPDIWKWFGNNYRCHLENREDHSRVLSLSGVEFAGPYSDGSIDVIFPSEMINKIKSLLSKSGENSQDSLKGRNDLREVKSSPRAKNGCDVSSDT